MNRISKKLYVPQLATLATAIPAQGDWICEPKYDGYRLGVVRDDSGVKLLSRNGLDWSEKFPDLVNGLASILPTGTVLDGELMAEEKGKGNFQNLQRVFKDQKSAKRVRFYAFDILFSNGKDLRKEPLEARRKVLERILKKRILKKGKPPVRLVPRLRGGFEKALNQAIKSGFEGILLKLESSRYQGGRGKAWLKIKQNGREEFALIGYSPHSKLPKAIGALLLGMRLSGSDWLYCGKVGTGFDHKLRCDLYKKLSPGGSAKLSIINNEWVPRRDAILVRPRFAAEIEFTEWTTDGMLRHPVFSALRQDKTAAEVLAKNSSNPLVKRVLGK